MVKDAQVRVLRRKLMEGKTQESAAAGAGMSVGSARKWRAGQYPTQARKRHWWRNRPDPFAEVFESDVVALLAADEKRVLEARTIPSWASLIGIIRVVFPRAGCARYSAGSASGGR
jgi:hypothetical protein